MEVLNQLEARRLALARGGLMARRWSDLPRRAAGGGVRAQHRCLEIIRRFGYLQLDSVSVTGARSHGLVLLSRLEGLDPELPERLLRPGSELFEYWGHEASWLPLESYPAFEFRRQEFRVHPWWGDLLGENPQIADGILNRLHRNGPLTSAEIGSGRSGGWWDLGPTKKVAIALWSSGEIGVRERKGFQRTFDLMHRLVPNELRERPWSTGRSLRYLLLRALDGHGWATTSTLVDTWRLQKLRPQVLSALAELQDEGKILPCRLHHGAGDRLQGWIRPSHVEQARRLRRARPPRDRGILLSPFDPVLWDRQRVQLLFDFEQVLEIYKPAAQRRWGYYCLPVLAGDALVARVDIKAHRNRQHLEIRNLHYESTPPTAAHRSAVATALQRHSAALDCSLNS